MGPGGGKIRWPSVFFLAQIGDPPVRAIWLCTSLWPQLRESLPPVVPSRINSPPVPIRFPFTSHLQISYARDARVTSRFRSSEAIR
jgi:hypothetical protein